MRQIILPGLFAAPLPEMQQGRKRIRRFPELKLFELGYSVSPKTFHWILVEGCVRTDDRNLFNYRLRNYEPVKRVTMMKRQRRQRRRMAGLDRQNQKTVLNNAPIKERLKRLVQLIFAEADFNGQLPVHRRADQFGGCNVLNKASSRRTELRVAKHKPEESVCVQEDFHCMYSAKSFRCSSSSARITRLPLQEPNRGCPSTGKGRSSATG